MTQRRTHVLAAALDRLSPGHRQLLGWMATPPSPLDWPTLRAINPFVLAPSGSDAAAFGELDRALDDLQDRGLIWWDRTVNTYDLHPVVRGVAHDQLAPRDRERAYHQARDYFASLPADEAAVPRSVEDLQRSITIFRALVGCGAAAVLATCIAGLRYQSSLAGMLTVRSQWLADQGRLDEAVGATEQILRLLENRGSLTVHAEARQAVLLARMGRRAASSAAVDSLLAGLAEIEPALHPSLDLAEALHRLGRDQEAVPLALAAHRRAWADGLPYVLHWELQRALALLADLSVAAPVLPIADRASVVVPHEQTIRDLIARRRRTWRRWLRRS